ncbi:hypothetical protein GBAR_LOCUS1277, partial [Geodia barretti]
MAQAGDPEWNEEEAQKRDVRAITTQAVREKRREIIRQIRKIQPQAGKNLKDVEVPQSLFQLARDIVRDPEASLRFNKVAVYELLLGDLNRRRRESANSGGVTLDKAVPVLDGWKLASISLFRYALNLVLAPNRAEFKKMKLSTSFYVYNISRHLHHAEEAFKAMGYRATDKKEKKETQDLVYDGDVKLPPVLETATDLLVMHEEVVHLQEAVAMLLNCGRREVPLENVVGKRRLEFVRAQQGSGIAPSGSPNLHPTPAHLCQPSSPYCSNPPLPTRVPPPKLVSGGVGQNAPVSTGPAFPSNVVHGHEWMHQQAGQKRTDHDYANMSRMDGNIVVTDAAASSNNPPAKGYINFQVGEVGSRAPQMVPTFRPQVPATTSRPMEGAQEGIYYQNQQQSPHNPGYPHHTMNTTYSHQYQNQTP